MLLALALELHAGLLGPVNQTFTILAKTVPGLTEFMKENNIKGSGCGGDLNGPTIKKMPENRPEDALDSLV